ncbi:MAG: response regulator [Myxococcales bacterium]|nr:MAG: response regulator [Myxococcales bacterium]
MAEGAGPTVWVVDDSPLQARVCQTALSARYDVTVFDGGAAVLETLSLGEAPELLVLDWHMPDMSGVDVCRFVRQTVDSAQLPILILTANSTNESLLEGLAAGANDFVRKPFLTPELNARVAALVRSAALHRKLLATEKQLRVEADFRERFMGMLAHDLRQPLNSIFMANGALVSALAGSPLSKSAEIQRRAAGRMKHMIEEMLDFTRIRPETGMPIHRAPTDFAAAAAGIVEEMKSSHPEKSFDLQVVGDCVGNWDPERLAQVCTNLICNAVEHGAPGTPVLIRLDGTDSAAVEMSVSNVGQPIAPDVLAQLFLPFRRATGKVPGTGVGLGLYIVEQIVSAHGGAIAAHSDHAATRFVARLPRA